MYCKPGNYHFSYHFLLNREQDSDTSKGGAWSKNETGLSSKSRVVILAGLALLCALMYTYQFALLY